MYFIWKGVSNFRAGTRTYVHFNPSKEILTIIERWNSVCNFFNHLFARSCETGLSALLSLFVHLARCFPLFLRLSRIYADLTWLTRRGLTKWNVCRGLNSPEVWETKKQEDRFRFSKVEDRFFLRISPTIIFIARAFALAFSLWNEDFTGEFGNREQRIVAQSQVDVWPAGRYDQQNPQFT